MKKIKMMKKILKKISRRQSRTKISLFILFVESEGNSNES